MPDDAVKTPTETIEGRVMLPMPGGLCLTVCTEVNNTEDEAVPRGAIELKCTFGDRPLDAALKPQRDALGAAMGHATRMVRLVEPQRPGRLRDMTLKLGCDGPAAAVRDVLPQWLSLGLEAWAAAAGAWSDRITRRLAIDGARHTVLLAGLDAAEPDPSAWGTLHPLDPALEEAAVSALRASAADAPWCDALIVLPGDEARYAPLRRELNRCLPKAMVCLADSLTALTSSEGVIRRPRVGEAWFPLVDVGASQATLHRIRVVVTPWRQPRREPPPANIVFEPALAKDPGDGVGAAKPVPDLLRAWREVETPASPRQWKTVVQLPSAFTALTGPSYQLALAMADRMARGREWPGSGRVFATGSVSTDVAGRVGDVDQIQPKMNALLAEARQGDTILLPDAEGWREAAAFRLGGLASDGTCGGGSRPLVMFVRQILP